MLEVRACTVCFSTNRELFPITKGQLSRDYFLVSGLKAFDRKGMPEFLCYECTAYVRRFKKFRDKCHRAHFALKEFIKTTKEIKIDDIKLLDTKLLNVESTLSYLDLRRTHCEQTKFRWVKQSRLGVVKVNRIPVFHCSTTEIANQFEVPNKQTRLSNSANVHLIKIEADEYDPSIDIDCMLDSKNFDSLGPSTSNDAADLQENHLEDNNIGSDNDHVEIFNSIVGKSEKDVDGSSFNEEYAAMVPISEKEAKAVIEVYRKCYDYGKYTCDICQKGFYNEARYKVHLRMHDQHTSGNFLCTLCHFYYKTEFLLKVHMTEKHMYKYLCKKCPEVSFDRPSAKKHYVKSHVSKSELVKYQWYSKPPSWLSKRGGFRAKGETKGSKAKVLAQLDVKQRHKLPDDFLIYTPVSQEEQYELVSERQKTRNYIEAQYKCNLCYKGFREAGTCAKHMKKHDPNVSGKLQCDMCKLYFSNTRKMYKHMIITHLFKYSCRVCSFVCYNRGQAQLHYKWHNNVTYPCPHCTKVFKKLSTRLTHIRIKHPSTCICNLCGHSFVSKNGLFCHKNLAHSKEEIEQSEATTAATEGANYCAECGVSFVSEAAYKTHLGSSNKHAATNLSSKPARAGKSNSTSGGGGGAPRRRRGRPRHGASEIVNTGVPTPSTCEVVSGPARKRGRRPGSQILNIGVATASDCVVCGKTLVNDVAARRHYESEHPGTEYLKRYMCDVCGHTTRQYANLLVHMRTHTNEKPYECPHCDRRFSMPSNRDRHIVVHTGEKRYQCQHCSRRFTQSSAVKLHIQTVHLKIPYAPWDKKNRKRRKEMENAIAAPLGVNATVLPQQPKLLLDPQADYLNAYITYNE